MEARSRDLFVLIESVIRFPELSESENNKRSCEQTSNVTMSGIFRSFDVNPGNSSSADYHVTQMMLVFPTYDSFFKWSIFTWDNAYRRKDGKLCA